MLNGPELIKRVKQVNRVKSAPEIFCDLLSVFFSVHMIVCWENKTANGAVDEVCQMIVTSNMLELQLVKGANNACEMSEK